MKLYWDFQSEIPPTPVLPSEDRLPASNPSRSPSISIQSPRQRPTLPRKLKYTAASTSLYSNWSSTSVNEQFSPRFSPYRQAKSSRHHSTPAGMQSLQSPISKSDWHLPIASPGDWHDESPRSRSTDDRSYISYTKADDNSAEIWPALRRLEGKVDYLTHLLETSRNKCPPERHPRREMERSVSRSHFPAEKRSVPEIEMFIPSNATSYVPAERRHRNEMEVFISNSNQLQGMEAEGYEISPDNQDGSLKKDSLLAIRARASSSMNFAVRLLREFFMPADLRGKNVSGMRGKDQLDPARIQKIKNLVYEFYPTPPSERE